MSAWRPVLLEIGMMAFLTGCATLPPVSSHAATAACARDRSEIGVIDIGWHTGLIIPADEMQGDLKFVPQYFRVKPHDWIFGWGNRRYYMAENPSVWEGISALLPSHSVMLIRAVENLSAASDLPGVKVRWLPVTPENLHRLDNYIAAFLTVNHTDGLTVVGAGPYPRSKFFASPGTYDAFHTCNTWTVTALKTAGYPVHPAGVIFAGQVLSQLKTLPVCK
ncbi:DUF2459 domain-containing protein [Acidithiobacillus thiooxidans]|nr:DUF2459 domain-containing protein [Acidithiobacillus thiooxidans]MDX5935970.1 DUF2459 domain-containing protein [Acidithiobacillus thiooxidans]